MNSRITLTSLLCSTTLIAACGVDSFPQSAAGGTGATSEVGSGGFQGAGGAQNAGGAQSVGGEINASGGVGQTETTRRVDIDPDAGVWLSPDALSQCALTPERVRKFETLDAFEAAVIGDWALCGTTRIFGPADKSIGLRIARDGHWYKLVSSGSDTAALASGMLNEGVWEAFDIAQPGDPPRYQLDLNNIDQSFWPFVPILAEAPDVMRLTNEAGHGDYVHLD